MYRIRGHVELPANHLSRFRDTALWPLRCSSGLTCPGPSNGAPTTAPWSLKKKRRTRRGALRVCLVARIHPILAPLMRICTQTRMFGWVILLFHTDSASANIRSHPGPADANRSCTGPHVRAMRIPPLPLGTGVSPPPLPPVLSSEQHTPAISAPGNFQVAPPAMRRRALDRRQLLRVCTRGRRRSLRVQQAVVVAVAPST